MIIGFAGKAYSGKTTAAEMTGFQRMAFADELKRIATEVFGWDGKKDKKGRRLLQVIGTECGRAYDPDFWVRKLECRIAEISVWPTIPDVAIDDVRFNNEARMIRERGGESLLRLFGIDRD